jgi:osmotically-inducible protein OsmY
MHPEKESGVSGKSRTGKTWVNPNELHEQKKFADEMYKSEDVYSNTGTGQNLFGRSELTDQEKPAERSLTEAEIVESLKRSPEVDISHIKVRVEGHTVYLEGTVEEIDEIRAMENIAKNVPGVSKVESHIEVR